MDWNTIIPNCLKTITSERTGQIIAQNVPTLDCIPGVFKLIIYLLMYFSGMAAVLFVMIAGFKYLTSGGDAKQVGAAQQSLTYAIIGLVILFSSFIVINVIALVTGTNCITMFGFNVCR